jgi:ABC-type dipeptide/oligopeptide/nickel transport system permease component
MTATLEAARVVPVRERRRVRWPLSRRYLLSRLLNAALAVWAVVTIVFFALHISGDPSVVLLGPDATRADVARVHAQLGLDQPLLAQYGIFLAHCLTGDFPDSIRYGTSPVGVVLDRLPATLLLGVTGLLAGAVLGLSAGYYAAAGRHARLRRVPVSVLTALEAIPSFFLGVLLVALFTITWAVFPMSEEVSAQSLVLPAAVIALALAAPIARVFRASLVEALTADHVRLAEAKGLPRRVVTVRHVVLNALAPVVNVLGVQAGVVLGGAVVTESVFRWPGVGQLATSAFETRDYPLVLATVTLIAVGFVLINLVVDLVGALLDPRGARR